MKMRNSALLCLVDETQIVCNGNDDDRDVSDAQLAAHNYREVDATKPPHG